MMVLVDMMDGEGDCCGVSGVWCCCSGDWCVCKCVCMCMCVCVGVGGGGVSDWCGGGCDDSGDS